MCWVKTVIVVYKTAVFFNVDMSHISRRCQSRCTDSDEPSSTVDGANSRYQPSV